MKLLYPLFFFLILISWGCEEPHTQSLVYGSSAPAPAVDTLLQEFLDDYDRYFRDSLILSLTPGAAVVIVKDGEIVFLKGYGTRRNDESQPVDRHTVFRIGSLSKGFASILTGILIKESYLGWNENVQKHIPGFQLRDPAQARRIEVRHLLSHTDGLPYQAFSNLIDRGYDMESALRFFPSAKLAGKEGEYFGYQNVAYSLIEPVIESSTGQSYRELLKKKIFAPLGMDDASCDFDSIQSSKNHALPHHFTEEGWVADTITRKYYGYVAAGGVNASISDMGKWLKALLGRQPKVIPPEVLDEVYKPLIPTGFERAILPGFIARDSAFYGLGFRILIHEGDTLVYHAGFVNNFSSEIALNRKDEVGICVLFNAPSPMVGKCVPAFFQRWEEYRRRKAATSIFSE